MRRTLSMVAIAALLAALPGVSAEEGTLDLAVTLPAELHGASAFAAPGGVLWFDDVMGAADLSIAAPELHLALVEVWSYTPLTGTPADAEGELDLFADHRVHERVLSDAVVTLTARRDTFHSLAWTEGGRASLLATGDRLHAENVSWVRDTDVAIHALAEPLLFEGATERPDTVQASVLGQAVPFQYTVEPGTFTLVTREAAIRLDGAFGAYIAGATVAVGSDRALEIIELGSSYEMRPGSLYVPGEGWQGPGEHPERVDRYLQLRAADGALTLRTQGSWSSLHVPMADLAMDGVARLAKASGEVVVGSERHAVDATNLILGGQLAASLQPMGSAADGGARVSGAGDLTYLKTGAAVTEYASSSALAAAATLTGFAVLLAGLAYFWNSLKMFLIGLLVPLYARVEGKQVLTHEGRDLVYRLIQESPGVSASELAAQVEFGWSALVYHLKVLERNDLVISVRDGRYKRFFDKPSGLYANGRKLVVSVLRNDTTAAMAKLVRATPGLSQKEIAHRMGIAASSVHWHAKRLEDAGLVSRVRKGQSITYAPGEAWAKVEEMGLDASGRPEPRSGSAAPA